MVRALIDIGQKLNLLSDVDHDWLLDETGETSSDPIQLIEQAIESGALVIVDRPRSVH